MTKITKEMTIGQILREHPKTVEPLMLSGMHCLGCPGAQMETIEQAALIHQMDLEKLLKDLNAVAE